MSQERVGVYFRRGNPLTLIGPELKVGDRLPHFTAVDTEQKTVSSDALKGKVKLIAAVPSVDTPVCSDEIKRFNEMTTTLPGVQVVGISMDLPFAQTRWAEANGIKNILLLSDYRDRAFGEPFGVRIKETQLLARSIFVADEQDIIRYVEYLREQTNHPDYAAAMEAARKLAAVAPRPR